MNQSNDHTTHGSDQDAIRVSSQYKHALPA